jgi:hypothetical protein
VPRVSTSAHSPVLALWQGTTAVIENTMERTRTVWTANGAVHELTSSSVRLCVLQMSHTSAEKSTGVCIQTEWRS